MANSAGLASEWRERLARYQACRASGITIAKFCWQENVSTSAFYLWRRKLDRTQHYPEAIVDRRKEFAPVRLIGTIGTANVVAQLPGGTRLEIPMSDSDVFERAIRALIRVDAQCATTPHQGDTPC